MMILEVAHHVLHHVGVGRLDLACGARMLTTDVRVVVAVTLTGHPSTAHPARRDPREQPSRLRSALGESGGIGEQCDDLFVLLERDQRFPGGLPHDLTLVHPQTRVGGGVDDLAHRDGNPRRDSAVASRARPRDTSLVQLLAQRVQRITVQDAFHYLPHDRRGVGIRYAIH